MVVWGGLRPIQSQVVVDVLALLGFSIAVVAPPTRFHGAILFATAFFTVLLSGNLSNRWTIIFPMVPLLILQCLRRLFPNKWMSRIGLVLSFFLILLAGLLSVLFPAVELPPLLGAPYHVGVIDVFLPVAFQVDHSSNTINPNAPQNYVCPSEQDHISVRIWYPTLEEPSSIPYLRPLSAEAFCEETMIAGAPPPLKSFSWMLHTWRLTHMDAKRHAQPLEVAGGGEGLPIVAFSHGLGGNADLYSYQTSALAAHGYVVVVIDHTDGSAPVVPRKDGSLMRRNDSHVERLSLQGRFQLLKESRRVMTEYRAEEFLAAVEAMIRLNEENFDELATHNVSFVGKLNVREIHYMGHSFGGATSFHAAQKRPPASIIAHEPASNWIPDATRASLFDRKRLEGSRVVWEGQNIDAAEVKDDINVSVHDNEMLVLFSHEWATNKWGGVELLADMYERSVFGPNAAGSSGASKVIVLRGTHHSAFSDTCMLTPTWLARATGITGERNPLDSALEIHQHTLAFLKAVSSSRRRQDS